MGSMNKDMDATEFFVKAMYHWFFGLESLAEDYFYIAVLSLQVNMMHKREILDKMN